MINIKEYRNFLEQKKGQRNKLLELINDYNKKIKKIDIEMGHTRRAQFIIQKVAKEIQDNLSFWLSGEVTQALYSVFDVPYDFKLDITPKGNGVDANIKYIRDGNELDPIDDSGLGAVSIGAFALRIALREIKSQINKNTRNVVLLDEPFIRLKGKDFPYRSGILLKEICNRLNIQIICVSHTDEIIDSADKIFNVSLTNEDEWLVSNVS